MINKIKKLIAEGNIGLSFGLGKATYKMNRDSFKTKDKLIKKDRLHLEKVDSDNNYYYISDQVFPLVVHLEEEEGKLTIYFSPSHYNRLFISLPAYEDERIYGCGEQYTHLNLKNEKVKTWVNEHQGVMPIAKKILREKIFGVNPDYKAKLKDHQTYYASPTYFSSKNYFVSVDSDAYTTFDFKANKTEIVCREIPKSITIITGKDHLELVSRVNKYFGLQAPVPSWVHNGVILATQGGDEKMMSKYHEMKEAGCKIAGVWCQDWSGQHITEFGEQVFWNWELNEEHYKNMDQHIKELNADGVKFLGYINTFLKYDCKLYNEAKDLGYLVKKKDGSVYLIKSTTFDAGIVDLTNPDAFEWYKNIIKENMIGRGLSGWMADFGEYLPTDAVIYGGDPEKLHNSWPSLWAKCNYDAVKESGKLGEIFYFSRAMFSTGVKYSNSMWSGDQHVDYSDDQGLGSVVCSTLSMSMSGIGINHSDIGGYTTIFHMKRDAELMLRWSAMNIFTPIFRCHEGNRPKDNVQFNSEGVKDIFIKHSNVYALLRPYHEYVLNEYYEKGIPCSRPIFFHYDEEWAYEERNQMMYGSEVIVCPITRSKVEKKVFKLPQGEWVQFFTGKEVSGPEVEVETPLELPIAFYKKDSKFKYLFESIKL